MFIAHVFSEHACAMKRSPLRHPVAVLRQILGLGQQEMAELVGRSRRTIQAVELGSLQLSGDLAFAISEQTGINPAWLLAGNPDVPPINLRYEAFSKAEFESIQGKGGAPLEQVYGHEEPIQYKILGRARTIVVPLMMAVAAAIEKGQEGVAIYRVHRLIQSISEEFGWTSDELLAYAKHCRFWMSDPSGAMMQRLGGVLLEDPRKVPISTDQLFKTDEGVAKSDAKTETKIAKLISKKATKP